MSLIDDLRKAAKEIADAGHNGWGNLCSDAATALERQGYVGDWQPMVSAPFDGTKIEMLIRHHNYWTALKLDGKEKADKEWQGVCRGHWTDHNAGGWTWHGLAGSPVGWRPLSALNPKAAWPFPERRDISGG